MVTLNKKLSGCYKRVLIFLLVVIGIGLIAGGVVYLQVGGREGARSWMAEHAMNGVEKHLKSVDRRPDGISEEQIVQQFESVREAIRKQKVSLTSLYEVLKSYQTEFNDKKPSTPEVQAFFRKLDSTIIIDADGKQ